MGEGEAGEATGQMYKHSAWGVEEEAAGQVYKHPTWGVGKGEVCYNWTWPDTPGFRPDKNEVSSFRTDIDCVVTNT